MLFLAWIEKDKLLVTYPNTRYCKFTLSFGNNKKILLVPSDFDLCRDTRLIKEYVKNTVVYVTTVTAKHVYQQYVLLFNNQLHIKRLENPKISKQVIHNINKVLDSACQPAGSVVTNVSGSSNANNDYKSDHMVAPNPIREKRA